MKIAVLSDIHGNLPALKVVLEDIDLFGHTHESFFYRGRNKCALNPGSVGDPVGSLKLPEAHYALLEVFDGTIQVTHCALPYTTESI